MAIWTGAIQKVNEGFAPNDGTGDSIRAAFIKVDNSFQAVNSFLSNPTLDLNNVNLFGTITSVNGNIQSLVANSIVANNTTITSNLSVGNISATKGFYSNTITSLTGNTYITNVTVGGNIQVGANLNLGASIIPTANLQYDLGGPNNFFRNLYVQGQVQLNTVQASSDAGLLKLHAELAPGDTKDVGIFGKYNKNSANSYAFFGFQYTSNNFVYKVTPTDATQGNSIVYDGVYGEAQFGNLILSNSYPTANTLTTGGGASFAGNVYGKAFYGNLIGTTANISRLNVTGTVAGNLTVDGTVKSNGYDVITTSIIGNYGQLYQGGVIQGNAVFVSSAQSSSIYTGAITIPYGGLGVAGNITAGGINGPFYGTIVSPAQPNITSLGTLNSLTVSGTTSTNSLQATSIGATNATITGTMNLSGGSITNLSTLNMTGNINSPGFVGTLYGAVATAAQPTITSTGALTVPSLTTAGNVTAGNVTATKGTFTNIQGAVITAAQPNITSLGNLTNLVVDGNGTFSTVTAGNVTAANVITTRVYTDNYFFANGQSFVSTSLANTADITANIASGRNAGLSLTTTGVTAGTYGSATNIPTVVVDNKGRVTGITTNSISTSFTLNGTSGSGIVSGGSTLTLVGGNGFTATVSGGIVTMSTPQDIRTAATPTFAGLTVSGSITPNTNNTYNLGSAGSVFATVYGTTFSGVSTTAKYADLAEIYSSDAEYAPGTVVVFGGSAEITVTGEVGDERVAGVISTNPAYLMNNEAEGLPVALRGRVPVRVVGPVKKGDSLVTSSTPGVAFSIGRNRSYGQAVFAKAIEDNDSDAEKLVTAVIL
jgi:hypothetical protein